MEEQPTKIEFLDNQEDLARSINNDLESQQNNTDSEQNQEQNQEQNPEQNQEQFVDANVEEYTVDLNEPRFQSEEAQTEEFDIEETVFSYLSERHFRS